MWSPHINYVGLSYDKWGPQVFYMGAPENKKIQINNCPPNNHPRPPTTPHLGSPVKKIYLVCPFRTAVLLRQRLSFFCFEMYGLYSIAMVHKIYAQKGWAIRLGQGSPTNQLHQRYSGRWLMLVYDYSHNKFNRYSVLVTTFDVKSQTINRWRHSE